MIKLRCYLEGDKDVLEISILPSEDIHDLKNRIYQAWSESLECDSRELTLIKVDVPYPAIRDLIATSQYRPSANDLSLKAYDGINDVWPEQPCECHVHVFVILPDRVGRPTLGGIKDELAYSDLINSYEHIFINVFDWAKLEHSDLERNHIDEVQDEASVPNSVTNFERKLERAPYLPSNAHMTHFEHLYPAYFKLPENVTTEDESDEEHRCATPLEVIHITSLASYQWEKSWLGSAKLEAPVANAAFFFPLAYAPHDGTPPVRLNQNWPVRLLLNCKAVRDKKERLRKYCPRSDFLISKSALPRLLVEIDSSSTGPWPQELIRMLLKGAAIVRFANTLKAFRQGMNFVLCAIFIRDNGIATRYTLFQLQRDHAVYYREKIHSLNDSVGRIEFTRQLYNVLHVKVEDNEAKDTRRAIDEFHKLISEIKLFHSADRKGGGTADYADLDAHGYEVKPEVIVGDKDNILEPLLPQTPSHILTVYRSLDPNKEFITKKVRGESNELDILEHLNSIQPKSDHVISLLDSFHGQFGQWAILPKMDSVADCLVVPRSGLESKVEKVCFGLIEGLAYLHEHCIAHRDIKPDNLLVDRDFCLKIIDFDIAMWVKDEDEEVVGRYGTEGWMAPEVKMKLWHSPIKADRWACGHVILSLLDKFQKEDKPLRAFARKLTARYPKERPSLLQVELCSHSTPMHPEIGNVGKAGETKAERHRQDAMEVDGENTMSPQPEAKKRRFDERYQNGMRGSC